MTQHGKAASTSTPGPTIAPTSEDISSSRDHTSESSLTVDTSQQQESQIGNDSFARETVQQIETLVESFKTKGTKKSETIIKIGQILAAEPRGSEQLKSDSLEQFSSTLDGIEALAAKSNRHGEHVTGTLLGKRKDDSGRGGQQHAEFDRGNSAIPQSADIDNFIRAMSKENSVDSDHESENNEGQDSDNESGDRGRSNKKQ